MKKNCRTAACILVIVSLIFAVSCSKSTYGNPEYGYSFKAPDGIDIHKDASNFDYLIVKNGTDPSSPPSYAGVYVEDQKTNILTPENFVNSIILSVNMIGGDPEILENTLFEERGISRARLEYLVNYEEGSVSTLFLMAFKKNLVYTVVVTGSGNDYGYMRAAAYSVFSSMRFR